MIKSMTGFGRGESTDGKWVVECSSVNRKQLEIVVQMPREVSSAEAENLFRQQVQARVSRGRVVVQISVGGGVGEVGAAGSPVVDAALARTYLIQLQDLARHLGLGPVISLAEVARLPGVVQLQSGGSGLVLDAAAVEGAVGVAVDEMIRMRTVEGAHLAADIEGRLDEIEGLLRRITELAPGVVMRYREQLGQRLAEAGLSLSLDDERLLKEITLFADRCDIAEELSRATSHLKQFRTTLRMDEAVGRSLDFLSQEFFREFNTMGAKANHAELSHLVVAAKTELEKIREQVQNVE